MYAVSHGLLLSTVVWVEKGFQSRVQNGSLSPALQPCVGHLASIAAKGGPVHRRIISREEAVDMVAHVSQRSYFNPVPFAQMLCCLGGRERASSTA